MTSNYYIFNQTIFSDLAVTQHENTRIVYILIIAYNIIYMLTGGIICIYSIDILLYGISITQKHQLKVEISHKNCCMEMQLCTTFNKNKKTSGKFCFCGYFKIWRLSIYFSEMAISMSKL